MTLILGGTGANECIPAFRCSCRVCRNARKWRGKELRRNSCALIRSPDGERILIDMPPQIMSILSDLNVDDREISSVFFTHRHEDHILGARSLFQGRQEKGFALDRPAEVFLPRSAWQSMSRKFQPLTSGAGRLNFVTAYRPVWLGELKVTPLETGHLDAKKPGSGEETLGYLIQEKSGAGLAYLLDAPKRLPPATLTLLKKAAVDCLVSDCTFRKTDLKSGHSDLSGIRTLMDTVKPHRMIASHIGHQNMNHRDLEPLLEKYGIETGYDGMEISL